MDFITEKLKKIVHKNYKYIELLYGKSISQNIFENIQPVQYQSRDYYYLKIRNKNINGTYRITDANVRYKLNKVVPYDDISKNIYYNLLPKINN